MIEISKENKYKNDIISGVLPIFKESGMTSHDAVAKIRKLYETKRVGHTGTLDPMATGVLVVLIGRAAKAAEYVEKEQSNIRPFLGSELLQIPEI